MKCILILYTSVGLGHKTIAENIGFRLSNAGYEVKLHDVLKLQEGRLVDISKKVHAFLVYRLPFVWSWLYTSPTFSRITLPFRVKVASHNSEGVKKEIEQFRPDMVIATQTSASAIVAHLKKTSFYNGIFGITFSDFHFHPYWTYPEADFYLANIPEQVKEMQKWGYGNAKVFICGMTIKLPREINTMEVKKKLQIPEHAPVVLLSGGSLGVGMDTSFMARLHNSFEGYIVAVCGKNKETYDFLQEKFKSYSRVKIIGFYSPMDELYAIANVFVSKPGGLSVTEALQYHIPTQVQYWLPAQEELNYNYLLSHNLLLPPCSDTVKQVIDELTSGEFRRSLTRNPALADIVNPPMDVEKAVASMFHNQEHSTSTIG